MDENPEPSNSPPCSRFDIMSLVVGAIVDPHLVEHVRSDSDTPETVYGEFYKSQAFVREDLRLQNFPPELGCNLPRAIVALMFWSDATVVSQFGGRKV